MLVIGGCDLSYVEYGILIYDTTNNSWNFDKALTNFMLCKFSVVNAGNSLWIVGGGAHCFSFGMYYFGVERVDVSDKLEFRSVQRRVEYNDIKSVVEEEQGGDHECSVCLKRFISRNKLFQHVKTHK